MDTLIGLRQQQHHQEQQQQQQHLVVMRHGERQDDVDTTWSLSAQCPWDPPLSSYGLEQAHAAGLRLKLLELKITKVFCSPFLRCIETAMQTCRALELTDIYVCWQMSELLLRIKGAPEGHLSGWLWHKGKPPCLFISGSCIAVPNDVANGYPKDLKEQEEDINITPYVSSSMESHSLYKLKIHGLSEFTFRPQDSSANQSLEEREDQHQKIQNHQISIVPSDSNQYPEQGHEMVTSELQPLSTETSERSGCCPTPLKSNVTSALSQDSDRKYDGRENKIIESDYSHRAAVFDGHEEQGCLDVSDRVQENSESTRIDAESDTSGGERAIQDSESTVRGAGLSTQELDLLKSMAVAAAAAKTAAKTESLAAAAATATGTSSQSSLPVNITMPEYLPVMPESLKDAYARFDWAFKALPESCPHENILLVTHGDVVGRATAFFHPGAMTYEVAHTGFVIATRSSHDSGCSVMNGLSNGNEGVNAHAEGDDNVVVADSCLFDHDEGLDPPHKGSPSWSKWKLQDVETCASQGVLWMESDY